MTHRSLCITGYVVAACVAIFAAPTAAQPPPISPVQFLPGDTTIGPAGGSQITPVIARGGQFSLAVWVDASTGESGTAGAQSELDVVAVRLDADGALVDQTPFVISRGAGYQRDPLVSWNGENWLVVWENQSPTQFGYQTETFAARVSPAGVVLDQTPISPFGTEPHENASLTANGSGWLVVSHGWLAGEVGIHGRRIAADGTLPDPGIVTLIPDTFSGYYIVDLDSAGGEYLLSYMRNGACLGRRYTAGLSQIGAPIALPLVYRIESRGPEYFVLFSGGPSGDLFLGSPMTVSGTLLLPEGVLLADASEGWNEYDLTWDGTLWWISRHIGPRGLVFQRVTASGTLLDPVAFAINPGQIWSVSNHHIAGRAGGGGITAVWQMNVADDGFHLFYDIYAANVDDSTPPFDTGSPISLAAPTQLQPDIAAGSGQYLLVYSSIRSGLSRVLAQRISPGGDVLDAEPLVVDAGPIIGSPAAAWNGSSYLIAWTVDGTVVARRLGADGSFIDPAPITIMPGSSPDVAALGENFLVTASQSAPNPQFRFPVAKRVSGAGAVLDAEEIVLGNSFANFTRAATIGGRWLVTWQRNFTHNDPQSAVEAAFIDADGSADPEFVVLNSTGGTPDLAVSGGEALFIWRNNSTANANNYIAARRMTAAGSFIDASAFVVSDATGRQLDPVAAWDGNRFMTAWEDQRDQIAFFDARTDVYGARLRPTGNPAVEDPEGFAINVAGDPVISPALASLGGTTLQAVVVFRSESPWAAYRMGINLINPEAAAVQPEPAPAPLALEQNRPNPFRSSTELSFSIAQAEHVRLGVYDVSGRLVRMMVDREMTAGRHTVAWDGRDAESRTVSGGCTSTS